MLGLNMNAALEVLRELFQVTPLGDYVYNIREREGLGWDGPKVVAWGNACERAKQLLDRPDEEPEFDCDRVLRENDARLVYSETFRDGLGRVIPDPFPGCVLTWKGETISLGGLDERRARQAGGIYVYLRLTGISAVLANKLATSYAFLLPEDDL
jgi:hypothetical protein